MSAISQNWQDLRDVATGFSIEVAQDANTWRQAWRALEDSAPATVFQSEVWVGTWLETIGAEHRGVPAIVIARDSAENPILLLPLVLMRRGGLTVASFCGGKDANFNMPLLSPHGSWSALELQSLLGRAAQAMVPKPDLFVFSNQLEQWKRTRNPLLALPHQPSPSFAAKAILMHDGETFIAHVLSKDSRRKLAKKHRRLMTMGTVSFVEARSGPELEAVMQAFKRQKAVKMQAIGVHNAFETAPAQEFLTRLSQPQHASQAPTMEWFALKLNERIIAVYAGSIYQGHFHAMLNSYDADPEIAATSPGELLLNWLMRKCCDRGLKSFDLGTGEARYKSTYCDETEPLFEVIVPVGLVGHASAHVTKFSLSLKRKIKQSPLLWPLAKQFRARWHSFRRNENRVS